jgi:hypothetical protein
VTKIFVGIDVQTARGCALAAVDASGRSVACYWADAADPQVLAATVREGLERLGVQELAIGIDAPRGALKRPRRWYWDGRTRRWRNRRRSETGRGRHCEVVIAAHRLANPQWTPSRREAPGWMQLGFSLYRHLTGAGQLYEVFPTASYNLLAGEQLRVEIDLARFADGPKDMLDAYVAAATVREFVQRRGMEVGGGDGLGTIILPRPLPGPIPEVLRWPAA